MKDNKYFVSFSILSLGIVFLLFHFDGSEINWLSQSIAFISFGLIQSIITFFDKQS